MDLEADRGDREVNAKHSAISIQLDARDPLVQLPQFLLDHFASPEGLRAIVVFGAGSTGLDTMPRHLIVFIHILRRTQEAPQEEHLVR